MRRAIVGSRFDQSSAALSIRRKWPFVRKPLPTLRPMKLTRPLIKGSWTAFWAAGAPVGPYWLQLCWTALFSAGLAVPFTVLGFVRYGSGSGAWRNLAGWAEWYGRNLVVALCIGFIIHLLFAAWRGLLGADRIQALTGWRRTVFFSGTPLIGVALGLPVGLSVVGGGVLRYQFTDANTLVGMVLLSLLTTVILHFFWRARSRELIAQARVTEAQLRLLQAQIEPHFLFNTLANVQSLIDHDTPKAKAMLEAFTDYLRASLGPLRHADSTLEGELQMAQSYLLLLQMRMGERLAFTVDASAEARKAVLPPLLLQPLIENAIHHGLEPKVDGGTVRLVATVQDGDLRVVIEDDGLGLHAPRRPGRPGTGMALDNIRTRLLTRYGEAAELKLTALPAGTQATLTLPFTVTRKP